MYNLNYKSLWIKASAKCINVNVNYYIKLHTHTHTVLFVSW